MSKRLIADTSTTLARYTAKGGELRYTLEIHVADQTAEELIGVLRQCLEMLEEVAIVEEITGVTPSFRTERDRIVLLTERP